MSTATSGRAREYKVRADMETAGWEQIFRAAASKGPADLGMAHELHGLALIQVGTDNKTLGPAERARLLRAAWLCSALPIVANAAPRKAITYWQVVDGPPKQWGVWKP
jgi:hypothetical protein